MNFRRFGQSLARSNDLATPCPTSTGSFHFAPDNELRFHKQTTLANSTTIGQTNGSVNRKFEKEWGKSSFYGNRILRSGVLALSLKWKKTQLNPHDIYRQIFSVIFFTTLLTLSLLFLHKYVHIETQASLYISFETNSPSTRRNNVQRVHACWT